MQDNPLEDFRGVLGWIQTKKEKSKAEGKPWGWVMGLIAAVVVFIALAFAAYTAWKKGREIAKLKHKIDVDKEKKHQAEVDAKINANRDEQKKLQKQAEDLQKAIDRNKEAIAKAELERREAHSKIDRVSSWEDVDNLQE